MQHSSSGTSWCNICQDTLETSSEVSSGDKLTWSEVDYELTHSSASDAGCSDTSADDHASQIAKIASSLKPVCDGSVNNLNIHCHFTGSDASAASKQRSERVRICQIIMAMGIATLAVIALPAYFGNRGQGQHVVDNSDSCKLQIKATSNRLHQMMEQFEEFETMRIQWLDREATFQDQLSQAETTIKGLQTSKEAALASAQQWKTWHDHVDYQNMELRAVRDDQDVRMKNIKNKAAHLESQVSSLKKEKLQEPDTFPRFDTFSHFDSAHDRIQEMMDRMFD